MLSYLKVENIDNELIEFHLRQKNYYSLEGQVVTREYLINEMRNRSLYRKMLFRR